jgi:purine-nucleoside phosphorylase
MMKMNTAVEVITQQDEFAKAEQAAEFVRSRTSLKPQVALVLGSGLGAFADGLSESVTLAYADIPHFPKTSALGHAGKLVIGKVGDVVVAAMQGRVHYYEGLPLREVVFPMRVFGRLGVKAAIITNAAGGINTSYKQGALVVLSDHINLQGSNPLIGPNDERFGPRFPDMSRVYWKPYRQTALAEAKKLGIDVAEGVYLAVTGPSYETPAEIRAFRSWGADVVGMSTVSEVIAASHMGIRVLAVSCVTNMAAGILDQPLNHQEVLETGERVMGAFMLLLQAVIPKIAADRQNS